MINSKKVFALCATTLAGLSAVGTLSMAVNADTPKNGDTVLTYTKSTPTPADWGLSVPSSVQLDQKATGNASYLRYGNVKLAIVNADGSTFTSADAATFSVSGTSNVSGQGGDRLLGLRGSDGVIVPEYVYPADQGRIPSSAINYADSDDALEGRIQNLVISTANGAMERYVQFATDSDLVETIGGSGSYTSTISWTAQKEA